MHDQRNDVLNPCTGHCHFEDTNICQFCGQTHEEAVAWPKADFGTQLAIRGRARSRLDAIEARKLAEACARAKAA